MIDLGQPPILPSHFSQVPSPLAFPSITPTLLMSSEDVIELYEFLSTSTAGSQEQSDASSRFSDILFELMPVINILKGQESCSALFHVKPGGERASDDMTPSFLSLDFMNPTNDQEENVTCREETQVVGEALFKVLENYGDASIALPPGKFSSLPPGSEGLHETIRLAIQSARFYNYLGDAVCFQKALGYLEKLPDDLTRDNHSGLIRLLARGIERTKAVRDLRSRERQAWLAYLQEFESQLRHAATRLESRCSNLRLHVFYSTFRTTKTYEKHRSSLLELSGRVQLDEGEAAQVENYLQTSKVCDFIPGDERFHLFCLRIQALCCSAVANLWACDGYSRENSLFHSRSSSAAIPSLPSPPSSSASSFHSMHLTAPAIDSRDPLAVRSLAFANHAASDFPSAIQLRISTLLLSEFFAAFRSSEVDGWFAEFVSDFDPPDAEPETKASSAPFTTPSLSGLAEVSDKPLTRFCDSPTHSLSSCSQSPISDSSASASSVAISLPISSMPPSPLVVASRSDYLSLCNQVTLHHSPLRKLRLLFSLELLIVANLSATDAPGTDSIINEIERVFRRIRPRHLFRDLQLIAAFVPNSILDLTDEGKAFWDFSLASLSLKKEGVDRAVSRATSLIEAMTRRPASSSDPLSSDQLDLLERRQQSEALRMFTLAAKEGHAEAQRELGILYLSLPSITVDLPQPSPSFLGALYSGSNSSNNTPRGPDGDKYDPANVASALYWFGRAAAQGDAFSVQYLTHRGGAFSLPPSLRSHNSGANTISRPTIRAQSAVYRSSSTPPSPKVTRSPTGPSVSKLPRCLDSVQKFSA
ncbi:hypothetical protein DSO57_1006608 [Entomophthora muscae]|uniref:Uncharacterized protein n=1 Tax=Entomophthora muscae TaxID=34485 RepID=A0ACC2T7G9_9FUNG|nr:hypothetical protein DSO57_1006608 [Entomophthora muscae]